MSKPRAKAKSAAASSPSHNIRVEGSNVKIDTKSVPVSDFYSTSRIGSKIGSNPQGVDEFTAEQNELRALDCMKDGKVGTPVSGKVVPNAYPMINYPLEYSKLGELESTIKGHPTFKRNTKEYAWTKVSKDSELTPKIQIKVMSQESGLHPQYYVEYESLLMNFANEVLDPAGRESAKAGDVVLFGNEKFVIDRSFFELFGMPGVSLTGKRTSAGKYDYAFTIKSQSEEEDLIIMSDSTDFYEERSTTSKKTQVKWFAGNNVKNDTIDRLSEDLNKILHYQIGGTWKTYTARDIIRALFMLKTAGDALQVLLLFVFWHVDNENKNSAISTCDKVVFLLCMILGLKCFLTSADKSSGKKLRCIEYYDPVPRTLVDAKHDIDLEHKKIQAHNKKIIEVFKYLSANPSTPVMVSGDNNPRVFKKGFYNKIVIELTKINSDLDKAAEKIKRLTTAGEIDAKMNAFKEHFTINPFIRKQGDRIIFGLAKKLTKAYHAEFQGARAISNGFGTKSIFEHGVADSLTGGALSMLVASRRSRVLPSEVFGYLEFDDTEFDFIDKDEDETTQIGLYADLLQEIDTEAKNVLRTFDLDSDEINEITHITIKSELLYNFYLKNKVLYGEELRVLIQDIVENDIDLGYFSPVEEAASAHYYTYSPLIKSLRTTPPSPVLNREMPMKLISSKTPGPFKLIDAESQPDEFENIGYESSDSLRSNTSLSDYEQLTRNILYPTMTGVKFTLRNNNPFASPPGAAISPRKTIRSPPGAAISPRKTIRSAREGSFSKKPRIETSLNFTLDQEILPPPPINRMTRRLPFFGEPYVREYGGGGVKRKSARKRRIHKKLNNRTRKQ